MKYIFIFLALLCISACNNDDFHYYNTDDSPVSVVYEIQEGVEYTTDQTLNGAIVYGYYKNDIQIPSFGNVVMLENARKIINVSTWTNGTSTSEISESHVSIENGNIRIFNRVGSTINIGCHIKYIRID